MTKLRLKLISIVLLFYSKFQYDIIEEEALNNINYRTEWMSEIYFQAGSNSISIRKEYYGYDFYDFLGDVGGYLGLFLGWSLLGITIHFFDVIFLYLYCKREKELNNFRGYITFLIFNFNFNFTAE